MRANGSPNRARTCDNSINSRVLYQLSYQGIICICRANAIHHTTLTCRACFLCRMKEFAWRRPTLPGPCGPSTIGARGLNGRVRDGYVWNPSAIATKRAFVQQMRSRSIRSDTAVWMNGSAVVELKIIHTFRDVPIFISEFIL